MTITVPHFTSNQTTAKPPSDVIQAMEAGVTRVTRRAEIYEADGLTPWWPDDAKIARLVEGTVSVDYTSDERRKLDLTLDNSDKLLRPDANAGFWYDKIIKIFRGIEYSANSVSPPVAIINAPATNFAKEEARIKRFFEANGHKNVDMLMNTGYSQNDLLDYAWLVDWTGGTGTSPNIALLTSMWNQGMNILTIGAGQGALPHYTGFTSRNTTWGTYRVPGDAMIIPSNVTGSVLTQTGWMPNGLTSIASGFMQNASSGTAYYTGAIVYSARGGIWIDIHLPIASVMKSSGILDVYSGILSQVAVFMRGGNQVISWETQLGEFMIDGINWDNFPDKVKVTGRDYTKKMMLSKLSVNETFASGTLLEDIVVALAVNSGIDPLKIRSSIRSERITSDMSYPFGTDRWSIVKSACDSFNYEIFFDAYGYLIIRPYIDPTLGPITYSFSTGKAGNMVSWTKSISDSNIYNHIVVMSSPADGEERLPYYGEAVNSDPTSPTSTVRLNSDRVNSIQADWLTSDADCFALAVSQLKIASLESYDLSLSTIYYPWFEAGEIYEVLDPDRTAVEPTRFLMQGITYPLDLTPMSWTAKRVTYVNDPGNGAME